MSKPVPRSGHFTVHERMFLSSSSYIRPRWLHVRDPMGHKERNWDQVILRCAQHLYDPLCLAGLAVFITNSQ
jgi:hypothetical protein